MLARSLGNGSCKQVSVQPSRRRDSIIAFDRSDALQHPDCDKLEEGFAVSQLHPTTKSHLAATCMVNGTADLGGVAGGMVIWEGSLMCGIK